MNANNFSCKNGSIEHASSGACLQTPQSLKVINSTEGSVIFLRSSSAGSTEVPYSFSPGSLDYLTTLPEKGAGVYPSTLDVSYHLSALNRERVEKEKAPYKLELFDAYNLRASPNYTEEDPGYHLQLYSNGRQVADMNPSSRPVIVSTVPGGVIYVKLYTPQAQTQPYPQQPPVQIQPYPQNGDQLYPLNPVNPSNNLVTSPSNQMTINPSNNSDLTSNADLPSNSMEVTLQQMQSDLAAMAAALDASVNSLNTTISAAAAEESNSRNIWIWIAVGVGAILLVLIIGFLVYFLRKNRMVSKVKEKITEPFVM